MASVSHQYESLIQENGSYVLIFRGWAGKERADELLNLATELCVKQYSIKMFGKEILSPRLQWSCGDDHVTGHAYSGTNIETHQWPELLKSVRDDLARLTKCYMDSCLINFYRDGKDYIGAHRDKECLDINKMVMTVSTGASRKFVYTSVQGERKVSTLLHHGDLLMMYGRTNIDWKHELLKEPSLREPRGSFTFRVRSASTVEALRGASSSATAAK